MVIVYYLIYISVHILLTEYSLDNKPDSGAVETDKKAETGAYSLQTQGGPQSMDLMAPNLGQAGILPTGKVDNSRVIFLLMLKNVS